MQRTLLISSFLFLQIPIALAQTGAQTPRLPDGGTREVLVSIFIPSMPNAPFTATVNTEWTRMLADGTSIALKNHRLIARDKNGRIFQERRTLVPRDGKAESGISQTEISDPVRHLLYICMPQELVCQLEAFTPEEFLLPASASPPATAPKGNGTPDRESIGKQTVAGLETEGTRELMVIPTGTIGNDGPMISKYEYWYSARLGVNLLSRRQDPRLGIQKFEVSDVTLGDPEESLFAPPSGSKIIDLRKQEEIPTPETPPTN